MVDVRTKTRVEKNKLWHRDARVRVDAPERLPGAAPLLESGGPTESVVCTRILPQGCHGWDVLIAICAPEQGGSAGICLRPGATLVC